MKMRNSYPYQRTSERELLKNCHLKTTRIINFTLLPNSTMSFHEN